MLSPLIHTQAVEDLAAGSKQFLCLQTMCADLARNMTHTYVTLSIHNNNDQFVIS